MAMVIPKVNNEIAIMIYKSLLLLFLFGLNILLLHYLTYLAELFEFVNILISHLCVILYLLVVH